MTANDSKTVEAPGDRQTVRCVITLIHGTWARRASWTKTDSQLCQKIFQSLPPPIHITGFEWSGHNSPRARQRAGPELRGFLHGAVKNHPKAQHFVIGHSHGGNVALKAIESDDELAERVGVVCLSTPFLSVRSRDLGPFSVRTRRIVLPFVISFLASLLFNFFFPTVSKLVKYAIFFPLIKVFEILGRAWEHAAVRIRKELALKISPRTKLFIARVSGDEASAALATYHFLGLCAGKSIALLVNWLAKSRGAIRKLKTVEPDWPQSPWFISSLVALALAEYKIFGPIASDVIWLIAAGIIVAMVSVPLGRFAIVVLIICGLYLSSFLLMLTIPPFLVLLTILGLPLGGEMLLLAPFAEVSSEMSHLALGPCVIFPRSIRTIQTRGRCQG